MPVHPWSKWDRTGSFGSNCAGNNEVILPSEAHESKAAATAGSPRCARTPEMTRATYGAGLEWQPVLSPRSDRQADLREKRNLLVEFLGGERHRVCEKECSPTWE